VELVGVAVAEPRDVLRTRGGFRRDGEGRIVAGVTGVAGETWRLLRKMGRAKESGGTVVTGEDSAVSIWCWSSRHLRLIPRAASMVNVVAKIGQGGRELRVMRTSLAIAGVQPILRRHTRLGAISIGRNVGYASSIG
jgi:hypothetical protein